MSEIDRLISDVVAEENIAASPSDKGKKSKMPLRKIRILTFGTWDKSELKEFSISRGY